LTADQKQSNGLFLALATADLVRVKRTTLSSLPSAADRLRRQIDLTTEKVFAVSFEKAGPGQGAQNHLHRLTRQMCLLHHSLRGNNIPWSKIREERFQARPLVRLRGNC
jgi:hypothetical protein